MAEITQVEVALSGPVAITSVVISEAPGADGAPGTNGADGADGADGVGVPVGGTTGQVLAKASGTDYDTEWTDAAAGSGDVVGPASAVTARIATFSGTTGKLIADGGSTIANVLDRANHTSTQAISTVTGLQSALDGKAATSHTHASGDITGLAASATTDTTSASNISSGTLSIARVADGSVTLAKLANLAQSVILGRYTGSTGVPEAITVGPEFSLSGGTLALSSDPTNATNLASGTVADARLSANVPLLNTANTYTANGAASTPAVLISGTVFTGGTGTTTKPLFLIQPAGTTDSPNWSTAGTMFAINMASGFAGLPFALKTNGGSSNLAALDVGGSWYGANFYVQGGTVQVGVNSVNLGSVAGIAWSNNTSYSGTKDAGLDRNADGVIEVNNGTIGTFRDIKARAFISDERIRLKGYTVSGLSGISSPAAGDTAYVTDATTPTYLGALTGGGAVVCPVFYNGSAWVSC